MARTYHDWDRFLTRPTIAVGAETAGRGIAGKRVLITGAGGSIGSALAVACCQFPVQSLVVLDNSERGMHELGVELGGVDHDRDVTHVVGDVCDEPLVREVFEEFRPEVVFHAAGCKHVPLMESNPFAAVRTNVWGTFLLSSAALRHSAERFVLLSTDKAVQPASIMGATKRVAELIVASARGGTQMNAVRLGNVLGSSGSVGPVFLSQIAAGGPVVVTGREATRIFFTREEAVSLLLAATCSASGGILVPAVGSPQRVYELARFLIEQEAEAGSPGVEIVFSGLRPGDKLDERMTADQESVAERGELLLRLKTPDVSDELLHDTLSEVFETLKSRDVDRLLEAVRTIVPEYEPGASLLARAERSLQEMA